MRFELSPIPAAESRSPAARQAAQGRVRATTARFSNHRTAPGRAHRDSRSDCAPSQASRCGAAMDRSRGRLSSISRRAELVEASDLTKHRPHKHHLKEHPLNCLITPRARRAGARRIFLRGTEGSRRRLDSGSRWELNPRHRTAETTSAQRGNRLLWLITGSPRL